MTEKKRRLLTERPDSLEKGFLGRASLQRIVKALEHPSDLPVDSFQKKIFDLKAKIDPDEMDIVEWKKDYTFLKTVQDELESSGGWERYSPTKRRELQSRLIAVYSILVFENVDEVKINNSMSQQQKIKAIEDYINKIEEDKSSIREPITVGHEIEFDDQPLTTLRNNLARATWWKDYFPERSDLTMQISNFQDWLGKITFNEAEELLQYGLLGVSTLSKLRVCIIDQKPTDISHQVERLRNDKYQRLDPFEVSTHPSISWKLQYLDMYHLFNHRSRINLHETVTQVKLDQQHTEIMDFVLIALNSGRIPNHFPPFDSDFISKSGTINPMALESFGKASSDGYYYPLLKTRDTGTLLAYPNDKPKVNVELRSFLDFNIDEFGQLKQYVEFAELALYIINAIQSNSESQVDKQKIELWKIMINKWKTLIEDRDDLARKNKKLRYPGSSLGERFVKAEKTEMEGDELGKTYYECLGNHIYYYQGRDEVFRIKGNIIVQEFINGIRNLTN